MDTVTRKSSDARIRANRKYMEKTYKKLQVMIKPEEYDMIDSYCKTHNISKAQFIVNVCSDYISSHS